MRFLACATVAVVCSLHDAAFADDESPEISVEVRHGGSHADLASRACALKLPSPVHGRNLAIRASEDGVTLCRTDVHSPDDLVIALRMSSHGDRSRVVLAVGPP